MPKNQRDWQRELLEHGNAWRGQSLNFSAVSKVNCCWRVLLTSSSRQTDSQLSAITGCSAEFWNTLNLHLAAPKGTADKISHHWARRLVLLCSFIPHSWWKRLPVLPSALVSTPSSCWINICIYIERAGNSNNCWEGYSYYLQDSNQSRAQREDSHCLLKGQVLQYWTKNCHPSTKGSKITKYANLFSSTINNHQQDWHLQHRKQRNRFQRDTLLQCKGVRKIKCVRKINSQTPEVYVQKGDRGVL